MVTTAAVLLNTAGGLPHPPRSGGEERRAIRLAKELLSSDWGRKISLEEVARSVGLSRYHFLRVFKKAIGLSPRGFRTQQRIEAAKVMIRHGEPFSQVALAAGFSDQSHFTNKFRQLTGATPRQYFLAARKLSGRNIMRYRQSDSR